MSTRNLHIGGQERAAGWEVLNALPGPHVDHVGNANDLSAMAPASFDSIYASHVVEHLDYRDELERTLKGWFRVLKPGGTLYVSVPDLDVLCRLFLMRDQLDMGQRFFVMRMMFGGHEHEYDHHRTGLNQEFLTQFLLGAGFADVRRVPGFGLFNDTSEMRFRGVPISVNLVARKPGA